MNFDDHYDSNSARKQHDDFRTPDKFNIPKRREYGRNQYEINGDLLAIQEYVMHNASLEDNYILNLLQQWNHIIVK